MTRRNLLYNITAISLIFLILIFTSVFLKYFFNIDVVYQIVKDFYPITIAVAGAYLAYCFQRRQAFLASLRDLWEKSIEAKSALISYTHIENPDKAAFGAAHRSISQAIDSVRAVYYNVGESEKVIGHYPLEPLHDMLHILNAIGYVNVTDKKRTDGRRLIIQAWNSFRFAFLREFPRTQAPHPVTERSSSDPRRR